MTEEELKEYRKSPSWEKVFKNAFNGCLHAFKTQRNFTIHFLIAFLVIVLALWLRISFEKTLVLLLVIVFLLVVEMGNTTVERTVDLITDKWNPEARIAKDLGAGMVLMASLGAVVVGFLILFPPLWQKLFG
jgi:diacylglycerol kinase